MQNNMCPSSSRLQLCIYARERPSWRTRTGIDDDVARFTQKTDSTSIVGGWCHRNWKAVSPRLSDPASVSRVFVKNSMSSSLSEVLAGLRAGPQAALLALHQLNELILRSSDGAMAAAVPHLATLLTSPDTFSEPEVPLMAVRALATIVDTEPSTVRAMARSAVLAALGTVIEHLPDIAETGDATVTLISIIAAQFPSAVLKAGLLGSTLEIAEFLPPRSRRAAYVLAVHCAESVAGREDAALLLDAMPKLLGMINTHIAQIRPAMDALESGKPLASSSSNGAVGSSASLVSASAPAVLDQVTWDTVQLSSRALGRFLSHACALSSGCLARIRAQRDAGGSSGSGSAGSAGSASSQSDPAPRRRGQREAASAAQQPVPVWPIQSMQHLIRAGTLGSFAALLSLHARASAIAGMSIAPPPGMSGGPLNPSGSAGRGPSRGVLPLLRHSAFRAIMRAVTRALLLVPSQRVVLVRDTDILETAQGLLRAHARASGAPTTVSSLAPVSASGTAGDEASLDSDSGSEDDGDASGAPPPGSAPTFAGSESRQLPGPTDTANDTLPFAAGALAKHLAERLEDTLLLLQVLMPPAPSRE